MKREALNALLIALGILAAAFGLKGFLFSSNFIDGGVTGVSMLLSKVTPAPLAVWLPLVNAPFVALGYRHLGGAPAIQDLVGGQIDLMIAAAGDASAQVRACRRIRCVLAPTVAARRHGLLRGSTRQSRHPSTMDVSAGDDARLFGHADSFA